MSKFNPKRARAKRPCPLWVDAFQRDTQHLAADEVGAYMLILMAMWTRGACDFPDDDRRLAAVSRVSPRLWKGRIGPVIREFLTAQNGVLISERLRKEAAYVERQCKAQSDRKVSEKSANILKNKDVDLTADVTTDNTTDASSDQPTQLPNNPSITETIVSDGDAVDATDEIWSKHREWLTQQGIPDRQARSLIGKWLKDSTPEQVRNAFVDAFKAKTGDPVPYITEILKPAPDVQSLLAQAVRRSGSD